jgi:hypothetical protein
VILKIMEPDRGALIIVRLLSVLLIVGTILELGLYWAECSMAKPPVPVQMTPALFKLIWAVLGFAGLIKSKALAAWLSEKLDL